MAAHFVTFVLLFTALPLFAQAPSAEWRTIKTPHFRFHYPAEYEAWTLRAASRIESIRDAVVAEVGYAPTTVTDVLVMNPAADANGLTLSLLDHPRIVLYTEPPEPEVAVGEFGDWIDLLTVHETAHLVHLLRPSRNPLQRLMERLLPLNPIAMNAPRWVLEGYATVIEGRLTGSGRPNSAIRAAILRKWALSGELPTYDQLDSDTSFLGMSMAYLMGSAYLEWLGSDLTPLWARMTARQRRDFDTAFEGVFGEKPERLFGRFTAELTARAKEVQRAEASSLREGELWRETSRGTGDPAVSPDGSKLALVERNVRGEAKLVVLSTGPNEEEEKHRERIEKMLKRDPEDVAPVRTKPLPREPEHTLKLSDPGDITNPRWTRDGSAIVYTHRQPDRHGFLHHDLFMWRPSTGENRRVTELADVKDADPLPDGRSAVAVRNRFGFSQLVTVDLASGAVTERTPASLDRIVSHPRANADGRIAWAEHDASGWHVVVDGVALPERGVFAPEWGKDGALYGVLARGGFIEIARLDGQTAAVTRSMGAAIEPAPAPDGSIYFMSLETHGMVVRRVGPPPPAVTAAEGGGPAPVVFRSDDLPPARSYGIGRQEVGWLAGTTWTAYQKRHEFGVRIGDVAGRLDTIAVASNDTAAIASTWRGLPVAVTAHAFRLDDDRGLEVRGEYDHRAPHWSANVIAGGSSRAFAAGSIALRQRRTSETLRIAADSDRHARASLGLSARTKAMRIAITGEAGRRLTIGGYASSAVPDSHLVQRVLDPALPDAFAFAERYRAARAEVMLSAVSFFWRRYEGKVERPSGGREGPPDGLTALPIDVRGIELKVSSPSMPLLGTAALELTLGAAKVSGLRGTKAWLAMRWRP